jgi:hypothetical protein
MNTSKQIIYGRTAYEGFAKAIGSKLGLNVTLDDGASACIDKGGVIHMPGMSTYQTPAQFAVTCGVIVHELSHQFYGSHSLIDPNRDRLEHDCLNAVLDVADETWVSEWFARLGNIRPGELLDASNADAFCKNARHFSNWNDPSTHAWKVLCIGILSARRVRRLNRWKRYTIQQAAALNVDAKACFRLLRKAVRAKKQSPSPTRHRFWKLNRLAKQLADLLRPFAPPAGSQTMPTSVPLDGALAAGRAQCGKGEREATAIEGEELAASTIGVGAGGGETDSPRSIAFDRYSFDLLSPAVNKVAQRIAVDGESAALDDGLMSGSRLGQAHRLVTDGQCLARWNTSDHADGVSVSVVLDCSGSMRNVQAEVAGIARAFAQNMRHAAAVQSLVFGNKVKESDDFNRVTDMGGTNTHLALEESLKWLADRPGQRWIVLITDGAPNDHDATDRVCRSAIANGVHLLAVGLNCELSMPAIIVTANDPAHLAIELDAAAQRIEQPA